MRRTLGILLLLTVLTACGEDGSTSASVEASQDATVSVDRDEQLLVSASDGGGTVDPVATPLPDETAATAFAGGLGDRLGGQVIEGAASFDVPPGQELYAAVVAIGCTPPERVLVATEDDVVRITAVKPKEDPQVQCLVPVTTVALVIAESAS